MKVRLNVARRLLPRQGRRDGPGRARGTARPERRGRARRTARRDRRGRARRENGGATVLVVGAVGVVVTVLAGAGLATAAVRDVHRARSAADLAALAGASAALEGHAGDCTRSSVVAVTNGARMTGCSRAADGSVVVTVEVPTRVTAVWPGLPDRARSRARAGVVSGPEHAP
jgi:secretion/DNA translocation related TadE-like protein